MVKLNREEREAGWLSDNEMEEIRHKASSRPKGEEPSHRPEEEKKGRRKGKKVSAKVKGEVSRLGPEKDEFVSLSDNQRYNILEAVKTKAYGGKIVKAEAKRLMEALERLLAKGAIGRARMILKGTLSPEQIETIFGETTPNNPENMEEEPQQNKKAQEEAEESSVASVEGQEGVAEEEKVEETKETGPGFVPQEEIEEDCLSWTTERPSSWNKTMVERHKKLCEEYEKKARWEKVVQDSAKEVLLSQAEEKDRELLVKWFDDHRELLAKSEAEGGMSIGKEMEFSDEKKAELANQADALERAREGDDYQEECQAVENIDALLKDLNKDIVPYQTQLLILHNFEERKSFLEEKERTATDEAEKQYVAGQLEELLEVRRAVAAKVSGNEKLAEDPEQRRQQAEKKLAGDKERLIGDFTAGHRERLERERYEECFNKHSGEFFREEEIPAAGIVPDEYAKAKLERIKEGINKKTKGSLTGEETLLLLENDYSVRDLEEARKTSWLTGNKIKLAGKRMKREEFQDFLKELKAASDKKINEETKSLAERDWTERERMTLDELKTEAAKQETKITELATSLENAEKSTRELYQELQDRLWKECIEEDLLEEGGEKMEKGLEAMEEYTKEQGVDSAKVIESILLRQGNYENMPAHYDEEAEGRLEDILYNTLGIELGEDDEISKYLNPQLYEKAVWQRKGFLELILDFFFAVLKSIEPEKTKPKEKQEKRKLPRSSRKTSPRKTKSTSPGGKAKR